MSVKNHQSIALCPLDDIPEDGAIGFKVENLKNNLNLFVVRNTEGIYVYENRCPHTGTPLDWQPDQFLDENHKLIQCSTHGALFRITDGYCVFGPCANQSLRSIPFEIRENQLYIFIQP